MAQSKPCFDDLPEDIIIEIFSHLRPNQLLFIERVNRTWKRCVEKTLHRVDVVVAFDNLNGRTNLCQHLQPLDWTKTLVIHDRKKVCVERDGRLCRPISTAKINSMVRLMKRCPQVKCLSLDNINDPEFKDVKSFRKLLKVLPQLECLRYCRIKIEKLIISEWLTLCKDFGPRLKHLTVKENKVQSKEIINSLIAASVNLEFFSLKWFMADKCHYLEALQNRDSIELALDFSYASEVEVDAEDTAVISRATDLSIELANLQSVGQHFPTFSRLKRLEIDPDPIVNQFVVMNFPALEYLYWKDRYNMNSSLLTKHLNNYNLTGLKTLEIHQLDDDVLAALADKLTNLEKLFLSNTGKYLPTDSLLLLSRRLVFLKVYYKFNRDKHFLKVVRLFEVVAEMTQLKRCRIDVTPAHYKSSDKRSKEFDRELRQANKKLRQSLPFVEIDFRFFKWLDDTCDGEKSDSDQEERSDTSMYDDLTSEDNDDSTIENSDSDDSDESSSGSSDELEDTE